ncbi:hypothetical protein FQN54_001483 [Arachnomyces sp. PD_36]|nr:hypothetical protein FQN54_001483 [Arachnomyces sp. PD_36]
MLIPSIQNIGLLALAVFSTFGPVLGAYNITRKLKPQGPLGVRLDHSLALSWPQPQDKHRNDIARNWLYSTHLVFNKPVEDSISGRQLWKIARDAVDEMVVERQRYGISEGAQPNALAILAWGNQIIISSTQKGSPSFSYGYYHTEVLESLNICHKVWADVTQSKGEIKGHKGTGRCAEPMAAHLYYSLETIPLQNHNARIGTWVYVRDGDWTQIDPCGDPRKPNWGCNLFVKHQNLRVLDKTLEPDDYNLDEIAGGVALIDQIQLCSVLR